MAGPDYDQDPDYKPDPDFYLKICVSGQRNNGLNFGDDQVARRRFVVSD